jgi:NTE family protein
MWMHKNLLIILILVTTCSSAVAQEDSTWTIRPHYREVTSRQNGFLPRRDLARPRVGLALSGGGARGFAHIGVLMALEEAGIPIDVVAGTSMGCVIGGLYAAGHSPEDLQRIANEIEWDGIFIDDPARTSLFLTQKQEEYHSIFRLRFDGLQLSFPSGLTSAQKLSDLLADLTMTASYRAAGDFDNLRVSFRAVVTDMVSGQSIAISEGDLGEALRAGLAVPLIFTPVDKDTMLLADGGLLDNIPVDVVREAGADVVVAVDVSSPLSDKQQLEKPWALAEQIIAIMMREHMRSSLSRADVVIGPDLGGHHAIEYDRIDEVIAAGREAGRRMVPEIRRLLDTYQVDRNDTTSFVLTSMEIPEGVRWDARNLPRPPFLLGQRISEGEIRNYLGVLYRTGPFQDVWASLSKRSEGIHLIIQIQEMARFSGYRLEGNTLFSGDELLAETALSPGDHLDPQLVDRDLQAILKRYHSEGYALARFSRVEMDREQGIVLGQLEEGLIQRIVYKGNEKTKRWVLSREFSLKQDDIFNLDRAQRGIQNIYGTGLFERVSMEIRRGSREAIVVVRVKERGSLSLAVGAQYDLEREAEAFGLLAEENLLGVGSKLQLYYQFGKIRERAQVALKADRIFKTYLTFNFKGYWNRRDWILYGDGDEEGEYGIYRRGTRFFLGQHIRRFGTLSAEGRVERIKINRISGRGYPTGKGEIRSLVLRSQINTLDRLHFPTAGHAHSAYLEIGQPILGGTEEFRKTYFSLESYLTGWGRHTVFARGSIGVSESPLPFSEQFRLGGEESLYGFRQGELMGNKLFVLNAGYRMELVDRFYFGVRYDVGNVWEHELQIKWKTTKHAIGVNLALDTPLGPVTLTYGRAAEGQERAYFSAGFRF